jgi:hypothetical protein
MSDDETSGQSELSKTGAPKEFSQLAELHVAGLFAEAGWRVYFPYRDDGYDFIAAKSIGKELLIRPVQVKGKYPEAEKLDKRVYGYIGKLTQKHPDMVLAIPYFETGDIPILRHVAFMPLCMIRSRPRGSRCQPAKFISGVPSPRGDHAKYFDSFGLSRLEDTKWSTIPLLTDDE